MYELSGPTLFAPVIRMACNLAQQPHQTFNYLILLILTDGAIQDIEDTTDALVVASYLPMSVLIVGIGDADFQSMAFLDADDKVLRSTLGRPSERDVVQFVPFKKYQNNAERLAAELLAELPGQFLAFCKGRGIRPPPPAPGPDVKEDDPEPPANAVHQQG